MRVEHSFETFKLVFLLKSELKAEIVSFLNSRTGGTIYLGINNDGSAVVFKANEEKRKTFQESERVSNWKIEWILIYRNDNVGYCCYRNQQRWIGVQQVVFS